MFHHLIKKFPLFQGIHSFIPVFKKARHLSPSRTTRIQYTTSHPIYLTIILILSPFYVQVFKYPLSFRFPQRRRQYALPLFSKCATCPAHSHDPPYIDLLNLHKHYDSKKVSTTSDATTQHEMLKMKEDILLKLSVYGQTQENVVLNHTTGLRIDCFCFQRRLRRKVGCES